MSRGQASLQLGGLGFRGQPTEQIMIKPPAFEEIIAMPLSEADKNTFLADQAFIRSLEWAVRHQDLFSEVAK